MDNKYYSAKFMYAFTCISLMCEACHTLEFDASYIFKPPTTLLNIYLGPMHDLVGFRHSEAPSSGETLINQLIGSQTYRLPIWPISGGGRPVELYHWLC